MCGLSGWALSPSMATKYALQAEKFTLSQQHRGPDSIGAFHSENGQVYLGHNRLSIIDLTDAGNQPMYSEAGDVMILNGEIYNYRDLKAELTAKGYTFRSSSDTEVAVKAFEHWGIEFTNKLKGMYAIAIWSPKTQTLHLLRDPLGIKPLYYWLLPNKQGLVFASELRAFQSLSEFKTSIDKNSLSEYLEFGYTFSEDSTIFNDVHKLQPGCRIEAKDHQVSPQIRFYSPDLHPPKELGISDLENELYQTLSDVIQEHLVADVPVGLLLSGGLDSSLIAAIASKHEKIHTFTMGFDDSLVDERPFARLVSEHIGSTHKEFLINSSEIMSDLESVTAHYDDIFADWGMVSTRLLYQKCKQQGVKVVLVGEGSDELFGGYNVFKQSLNESKTPLIWKLFQLYRSYAGRRYGSNFGKFRSIMNGYLTQCNGDLFNAIRLFESRNQVPNNYAMKVDKASMSISVEARAPFLDSRIADLAYRISRDQLINRNDEKLILKSLAKRYQLLPDEILDRRKFGAGIAFNWIEDSPSFRAYARDIILAENSWVDELNLRDAMQRFFDNGQQGYGFPHSISVFRNLAWRLLILSLWGSSLGISR